MVSNESLGASPEQTSNSDRPVIVSVRDVRKVYMHDDKRLEVLRGVSLSIFEGELLSIVGRSGAGKSTLLHLMGTLDLPTSGTIELAGRNVTKMSGSDLANLRNRMVGFVFQFHHLLPEFTALENVIMPGLIHGGYTRNELKDRGEQFLRDVNLDHRMSHRPNELSGGEQQRVALARALVLSPKILLADEPTGNLDSDNSKQVHELFFQLNEKHRTTMVIVTHNDGLARAMPRVVVMRDGQIESESSNETLEPSKADVPVAPVQSVSSELEQAAIDN